MTDRIEIYRARSLVPGRSGWRWETWAPIPGWEGYYEASTLGRIRGVDRVIVDKLGGKRRRRGQLMSGHVSRAGYMTVHLRRDGASRTRPVHKLVADAFLPAREGDQVVRHLDGDSLNNCLDNLARGTYSDNAIDTVRHGRHPEASKTHCVNGHEYTPENTYTHRGYRQCRACRAEVDEQRRPRVRPKVYPHGTRPRYRAGCRCDRCRAHNAALARKYRASRKEVA